LQTVLLSEHEYVICNHKKARKVDPQNKLNELTGSEWFFFTKSVIMTSYPLEFKHELRQAGSSYADSIIPQENSPYI